MAAGDFVGPPESLTLMQTHDIKGEYTVKVWQEPDDEFFLAEVRKDGETLGYTQGKNEYDLFSMLADFLHVSMEVEFPWHVRVTNFLHQVVWKLKELWWYLTE